MQPSDNQLKSLLDKKAALYNTHSFIETDPIQIPHLFKYKADVEIAAFLTASIAWGQRVTIINNARRIIYLMDNCPFEFISGASQKEFQLFESFVHRTFQAVDCIFFLKSLQYIYKTKGGLEAVFTSGYLQSGSIYGALIHFRNTFFQTKHLPRSEKHISNVETNASAKRLNMFLRWMVRNDSCGVDFGLWKNIPVSALMLPLDVHTGNIARKLGILNRTQNDWNAVEEVTAVLRNFDSNDPIKYDFALFGMGAFE